MSCEKCLGDHHTAKHCTTGERCLKCKGSHETKVCPDLSVWCSHCQNNVKHDSKEDCPSFFARTQKLIGGAKKSSKKSYAEALRKANQINTENTYSMLQQNESEETETPEVRSQIKFPRMSRNHNPVKPFVFGKRQRTHSPETSTYNQDSFTAQEMSTPSKSEGLNSRKQKFYAGKKPGFVKRNETKRNETKRKKRKNF
jgi:hypothetical protein